jgi:hypothetical protein
MPECEPGTFYSNPFQDTAYTSQDIDVPGTIALESSVDGVTCSRAFTAVSHVDSAVNVVYTAEPGDSGNVEFVNLTSELTFDGLEVSASIGTDGVGGSFSVQGNTITYAAEFPNAQGQEYRAFDLEGDALAITDITQRDTVQFRINGTDYVIDHELGT